MHVSQVRVCSASIQGDVYEWRIYLRQQTHNIMLHWTLVFLVLALIAAILGFGGLAGTAIGIAKILFFVFLVVWLISFLLTRRSV